ncbi:MAG TPA: extracellular solute-binding protein [Candidatus Acidoferrales bacterium]|nr:extracellular solute-binding protein [Candidatus Acidoferrales bacterium]
MKPFFERYGVALCSFLAFVIAFSQAARAEAWQEEWEKTLRAAEAEGQFTLYGCCYDFDRILEGFRKKFPKIKVTTVVASGSQLSNRILAERRAEKYIADAFSGGANTSHDVLYKARALDPIAPVLLLPEVLDTANWYEREHRYIDPENKYIFAYVANSQSGQIAYNTKLVNPREFKSHWDLLQPKWKGKIVSLDPTAGGMGGALQLFYYHPQLGPEFIAKLYGEMQVTISRDSRLMTDWLSSGKFALCIRCTAGGEVGKAKQQGLPIDFLDTASWKEGGSSSASGGTLALPSRAPHPNAARVFVNWFLSREGQIALQKYGRPDAHNSRRIDIPKDDVDPFNRLEPGKKYFDLARPEYQDLTAIFKLVKAVLRTSAQ